MRKQVNRSVLSFSLSLLLYLAALRFNFNCKISFDHVAEFIAQVGKQEHAKKAVELNSSTIRSRLAELESSHENHETDNAHLRRDKMLLVDHVADLQKRVSVLKSSFK